MVFGLRLAADRRRALVQAGWKRRAADPLRWHWLGLSVGFALLSVDEIAGMHETLNSVTDISWAVPGGILALLVGLSYLKFLWRLDRRTAVWFAIGGAIFLGGAVGVELYTEPFLENDQLNTLAYNLWTGLEEGMEMAGVLVFLSVLLRLMKREADGRRIEVSLRD